MKPEENREAAREQAERLGFDPEDMLVCLECGRTVVRKQSPIEPGHTDSVFCTCDPVGYPMHPVETGPYGTDNELSRSPEEIEDQVSDGRL